nr:leucine-rich repeat domain-containing protein [Pseudomonas sp. BCA13]
MTTPPDSHYALFNNALPHWLGQASAARRQAFSAAKPALGKALHSASAEHKALFKRWNANHWIAQNGVDDVLKNLQDPKAYAKPLLKGLLNQRFGVDLDVDAVFVRLYIPQTVPWLPIRSGGARAWTVSLLDAALHNFDYKEAAPDFYEPHSTFITRPSPSGQFETLPAVRAAMPINAFIHLCRELDIGARYALHLRKVLGLNHTPTGNALALKVDASQRAALRTALHLARIKGDVQEDFAQVIDAMVNGHLRLCIGREPVLCHDFSMMETALTGILLFAPDLERTTSAQRIVAYIPDDPEHPLKEYPSSWDFKQALTRQLRSDEYQVFFSRFVPHEKLGVFFSGLGQRLATLTWHPPEAGDKHGAWRNDPTDDPKLRFVSTPIQGDPWRHLYQRKLDKILNDARTLAVSSVSADSKARWALWDSFVKVAQSILNTALLVITPFIPGLGELMMGYMAYQLLNEVFEGVVDWAEGLTDQAFAHLIGTLQSLVQLGAFALGPQIALAEMRKLLSAETLAFMDRFKPVTLADRSRRYWQPDLAPYQQNIQVAPMQGVNEQGLHSLHGELILPLEGKYYAVQAAGNGHYVIKHPTRPEAYRPHLRHNQAGAWHSELEQPLQWDRDTLLRRVGHRAQDLSPADRERALSISGVEEGALRKMHLRSEPVPPLLDDSLIRLRIDREIQQLIQRLRSDDPAQYNAIDPQEQLQLLTSFGYWPKTKALRFLNAQGHVVWEFGDPHQPVVQIHEAQLNNGDLLKTVLQTLSPEEIRTPFGERSGDPQLSLEARTRSLRTALADIAERERASLFESRYGPSQITTDPHARQVMDLAHDLPASVAEHMVRQASGAELEQLDARRTPKRLADLGRAAVAEVRINRAYEGQHLDATPNIDSEHLALNSLKLLPGWSDQIQLVARHDSPEGSVWNRVGPDDAPLRRTLVRTEEGRYVPYDDTGALSGETDLYNAVLSALPDAQRDAVGLQIHQGAELRQRLRDNPLTRNELRTVLTTEPPATPPVETLKFLCNTDGYRPAGEPPVHPRARALYPTLDDQQLNALVAHLETLPGGASAQLTALEAERLQLETDLHTWQHDIPTRHPDTGERLAPGRRRYERQNRRRIAEQLMRCWHRETAVDDYYEDPSRDGHVLRLEFPIIGELPQLSANFEHVSLLSISGGAHTQGATGFISHFPRLRHLEVKDLPLGNLPPQLASLPALNTLGLSNCGIRLTPASHASLSGMSRLQTLVLNNNPLGLVPSVEAMPDLMALDLSETGIDRLPAGLLSRTELEAALLAGNEISDLPAALFETPPQTSTKYDLSDNPLSRESLERIKAYYQRYGTYWEADAQPVDIQDAQRLFPIMDKEEINRFIYGLPGDIEAGKRELARLAGDLQTLQQELSAWSGTPDLSVLEHARRLLVHVLLEKTWRRDPAQETRHIRALDINHTLAGELPRLSTRFEHVGSLVIQGNGGAMEVAGFLESFPALDILDLENIQLGDIPPRVFEHSKLTFLGLPRCSLTLSPSSRAALQNMPHLEYLDLSHNPQLGELPDFEQLPALSSILLHDTGLTQVPPGLLTNVPRNAVNLSGNAIEHLPDAAFTVPPEVARAFDLSGNPLSRAALERIKTYCQSTQESFHAEAPPDARLHVQRLYPTLVEGEADRFVFRLPGDMDAVAPTLTRLENEYRQLATDLDQWVLEVPERHPIDDTPLDDATRLREQTLRANFKVLVEQAWRRESPEDEESLHDDFSHALSLDTPVMGELPRLSADLEHVSRFELTGNGTTTTVDGTLRCFPRLQALSLNRCALGGLPQSIFSMPELTSLELTRCGISLTPATARTLSDLPKLDLLDLSNNPLDQAPDVSGLADLTSLHLRSTGLRALPEGVFRLKELHTLDLSDNQIEEISPELLDTTNLLEEDSDLSGNPWSAQSLEYLREYYRRTGIDFQVQAATVDEQGMPLSPDQPRPRRSELGSPALGGHRGQFERAAATALVAVFARGGAEEIAVGAGEVRPRGEAARQADLDDRLAGLHEHLAGLVQAQFQVVLAGDAIEVLLEDAFELSSRHAHVLGNFVGGQRFFNIGFHQQNSLGQLGVAGAQAVLQRNALALATFADTLHHQFFGYRTGQFGTVVTGQHCQQQVEHRHAATGGQAVTVPVEQMAGGNDLGEAFGEVILPAPVHGGAVAIEQAKLSQRVNAGRQAADHAAGPHKLLERGAQLRGDHGGRFIRQQEEFLETFELAGPRLARQLPGAVGLRLGEQKR